MVINSYITQTHIAPMLLSKLALCQGLNLEQLFWLSERLRYKTFPEGASFITAEQPGEVVYIILRGTVKIHVEQVDGTDVVLAILGAGDTVGEMSLVDSAGRSASVLTLEESVLLWMDRRTFQEAMQTIPMLALNLVKILSGRVRLANELVQALATLDVYGRVARQILAFADKYGQTSPEGAAIIPIRLTQGDIADLVGASRKRVNQVMVAFKQHGYIAVDQNCRITVQNKEALAKLCR